MRRYHNLSDGNFQVFNHTWCDAWSLPWKCLHRACVFFNYLDPGQPMKETAAKGCWDAFRFFFWGGVAEKSLKMLYLKIWVKYDVMHVKRGREREREGERERG